MNAPRKIFGTDGVRGTANIEPVTAETALRLGRAAGHVFKDIAPQSRGRGRHKIVIGKAVRIDDALGRYIEYAKSSFPKGMTLEGMRIVVDCAHGAAYKSTPCVLRELGAEIFDYGIQPDGMNINKDCGSMHPQQMCQKVWEHRAHLGISHDGDADRVLFCDETGKLIDGDDVMAICGLEMLAEGSLREKTLVATVMGNAGLDAAIKHAGGHVARAGVGDKNVIDEMLRSGFK